MDFIRGTSRHQVQFSCLEDNISSDNAVRLLYVFVDHLDLSLLGISGTTHKGEGRPPYHPSLLLKLYLYGYLNRIRSSRKLERECYRNIEVRWLTGELTPNYHSIADFRKLHPKALKALFKLFVLFLKEQGLLGGELVAIDGSKFRAQNSKKNNCNQKKIDRHQQYIDNKTEAYLQELDEMDSQEDQEESLKIRKEKVEQELLKLKERKIKYNKLQEQLNQTKDTQISTVDADSRALPIHRTIIEVAYNVQSAVDAKHNLIVVCGTTNETDYIALAPMAVAAKETMETETLTVLADKGYHYGKGIHKCEQENITTLVAYKEHNNSSQKMQLDYYTQKFQYDKQKDTYTCPQGEVLTTTGNWHEKKREEGKVSYRFKKYRTSYCNDCPVKHLCTGRAKGGREIERSEYQEAVERNNQRVEEQKEVYRRRQAIVEHPFGTMKRSWGYSYTLLKGLQKVSGEMALIFLTYNIRRSISIVGVKELIARVKVWKPDYQKALCLIQTALITPVLRPIQESAFLRAAVMHFKWAA